MNFLFQSVHVHVIENAVIEDDVSDPEVGIVSTVSVAEIGIGSVNGNAIVRGKEIVIGTENVITVNHIRESDHAAEKENVNVKEIVNIESEAEKKGKLNDLTRLLSCTRL
jgi:hypothetical protein